MEEKFYRIYYGDNEEEYTTVRLKDSDIIDGYLTEAKAFDLFYDNMIMANEYLTNNYDNLEPLVEQYDEESDYYEDEYQVFIIDFEYDEDFIAKVTKKMGNTLYYDKKNDIYLTGITDLGMSRDYVPTQIKVEEEK